MKAMKRIGPDEAVALFNGARRVLVCTHIQPDGDAIGSLLALGSLLKARGKDVELVCQDPVPDNLRFLPGWEKIKAPGELAGEGFDLFCSIDASDRERIGDGAKLMASAPVSLVIDHHTSNTLFGQYNYVDDKIAASGNLVCRLFDALHQALSPDDATCLYTALSTDTGNFSFGQMDEEFFLQVSKLMGAGLDIVKTARKLHLNKERSFVQLKARALSTLAFYCDSRLSAMQLTMRDFLETGTTPDLTEGLVNQALNINGVEMCYLATQLDEGHTKFSLRALSPHNVARIATEFGGGGHLLAAGCTMDLPLEQASARMRDRMMKDLCP